MTTAMTAFRLLARLGAETPPFDVALDDPERGDVPGWVLITLMTAGLVVLLWAVAGPALTALFEQALTRVSGI
ncbi:hypothetical protein GCM10025768_16810 [Microbacterium pseudoresistens]|uniref:Uncharacterized protein n=1 Tax=Microbacterium pseudoresistens TaxID=640634 RepID=A0A7Y9ESI1_9MICO|nr:hypothetical protein [Microbacterium pseudoresistens]NYD52966.1 hypothetical protein [Microbacterium pseudoresistens]